MSEAARPKIGVQDVVYAVMVPGSDVAGGTATYGTVKPLAGVGKISINPNGSITRLAGDNNAALHTVNSVGKKDVALDLADIDPAALAEILGHTAVGSGVVDNSLDIAPDIALGFKILHTGTSVYTYTWLYKGKFMEPDESVDTKGDTISMQRVSLKGEFTDLISIPGQWRYKDRTPSMSAGLIAAFFASVIFGPTVDLGALTLTSGAGVAGSKTMVLTFAKAGGGTTQIANASALNITAILDSDQSILTPVSFTAGAASTTPTVTILFSALTAAAHTVYVSAALKDLNGIACVAKAIAVTPSA